MFSSSSLDPASCNTIAKPCKVLVLTLPQVCQLFSSSVVTTLVQALAISYPGQIQRSISLFLVYATLICVFVKPVRERHVPYDLTYMWIPVNKINQWTKRKQQRHEFTE